MKKIFSGIKKHKKAYLLGTIGLTAVIGLGIALSWNCIQFNRYCKEKELCACAKKNLNSNEKKTFVAIAKYMKEAGKSAVDAGILKYTSADDLAEVSLKMKFCSADIARQKMLNNVVSNRKKFPGDYNCMRQVLMHDLSNNEILFLQSSQSKTIEALKNPIIREMYLTSSAKMMNCMNEQVQRQYQEEVKKIKELAQPKKKARKKQVIPKPAEEPPAQS